jgi:hypothetical protein
LNRPDHVDDHSFVVKRVDYLWHTDVHEIQVREETAGGSSTLYFITFVDKASRFIVHDRFVADKRSGICASVLSETFQMCASLSDLGSGNGSKATGGAVAPNTPEQNGSWSVSGEQMNIAREDVQPTAP